MIKSKTTKFVRRIVRRLAINHLKEVGIFDDLKKYMELTKSTGVSWSDFWELYKTVRAKKPQSILECGPGASTLVMTLALKENERDGFTGKITAMEEIEEYLIMSKELLPDNLHKYVNYVLSPRIDDSYEIFRGVIYRDIPEIDYDFVYIDGPEHHSPSDNQFCFDFDFIHVLKKSEIPVCGMIDYRLSTGFVLQKILGYDKVRYNYIKEIGVIEPCVKSDIRKLDLDSITEAFNQNGRIFGNTKIHIYSQN
jgi:hypothetical protein